MTDKPDYEKTATPAAHKTSHQDGGTDEISVDGLAGVLTAEQKSSWAQVSGKPTTFTPETHHARHEVGGDDEITFPFGLFEVEIYGGLMPVTDVGALDEYFELDDDDNIMPKAA